MNKNFIFPVVCLGSFLLGCSSDPKKNGTPALFDTRGEAEQAAKKFKCAGAHKMGDKWMPCKMHSSHHH